MCNQQQHHRPQISGKKSATGTGNPHHVRNVVHVAHSQVANNVRRTRHPTWCARQLASARRVAGHRTVHGYGFFFLDFRGADFVTFDRRRAWRGRSLAATNGHRVGSPWHRIHSRAIIISCHVLTAVLHAWIPRALDDGEYVEKRTRSLAFSFSFAFLDCNVRAHHHPAILGLSIRFAHELAFFLFLGGGGVFWVWVWIWFFG
ncbi:hypothetical protein SUGI_0893790 [Cryptomeria japonica]|nr:hypothetical protein SUGI_0893790 [Cryptomeria japonica]